MRYLSHLYLGIFTLMLVSACPAVADSHEEAVKALGMLNGTALQCQYTDEARRIKAAVIAHAPRTPIIGVVFQETTNESFLASAGDRSCPPREAISLEVDAAIKALQTATTLAP